MLVTLGAVYIYIYIYIVKLNKKVIRHRIETMYFRRI